MKDPSPEHKKQGGLSRAVEAGLSGESLSYLGVLEAIGGWRGIAESLLPAAVYLIFFMTTRDPQLSVLAPLSLSIVAILVRIFRREPVAAALAGLAGVIVCVLAVVFTGDGSNYFVPGFYINGAYIVVYTVSLLVGWPVIGFVLGFFRGSLTAWRKEPALFRAAQLTSIVWLLVFVSRLAVQLPLYFSDKTEALGIARLAMGIPLFALAVLFTWLVLSRVSSALDLLRESEFNNQSLSGDTAA